MSAPGLGRLVLAAFAGHLLLRLALVAAVPWNYAFDGWQRWGGREHLLVQDWLPATQSMLVLADALGGGILLARALLCAAAAGASAMAVGLAGQLGGWRAAAFALVIGAFGPFLTWSVVPYQEGTFLLFCLSAIWAGLRAREGQGPWWWADLLAGGVALCRYEGWPLVLLWLGWRREAGALGALWGPALWLGLKAAGLAEGHHASPVDYADWEGLGDRFDLGAYLASWRRLAGHMAGAGAWPLLAGGLTGLALALRERRPGAGLLALLLGSQLGALVFWMAGLETATVRMLAIPGVLLGIFAALALARLSERGRVWTAAAALIAASSAAWYVRDGWRDARGAVEAVRPEVELVQRLESCGPDCRLELHPRRGLGTRDRHDGCEIVQGLTERLHGRDLWCADWPGSPAGPPTHRATWRRGEGYLLEELSPP